MNEPFSGDTEFSGRRTLSHADRKLDAAVSALKVRIRGLSPRERLHIVGFTSVVHTIFTGEAGRTAEIDAALDALQATNGTDVAAALNAAADIMKANLRARVLLVSDCLTNFEPAVEAAGRLEALGAIIDVLLIDPTEEAEATARAVIRAGEVQAVVSAAELGEAVGAGDRAAVRVMEAVARAIEDAAASAARTQQSHTFAPSTKGPPDRVGFAAATPPEINPSRPASAHVIVHPASLKAAVDRIAEQLTKDDDIPPDITDRVIRAVIPRGSLLRIQPTIPGIDTNPTCVDITWDETIIIQKFRLSTRREYTGRTLSGSIDLYHGPACVAQLSVIIRVVDQPSSARPTTASCELLQSVFPSYSRKDQHVVDTCREYYEALGISVLQDTQELRARVGDDWPRVLHGLIARSDAVQLYWSHHAASSSEVEKEWRTALGLEHLKSSRFLRPVRWSEDTPTLPPELKNRQMGWLPLVSLPVALRASHATSPRLRPSAVIPLVDCQPEIRATIEHEYESAAAIIEEATGLHCCPPPILLVDTHAIQQMRSVDQAAVEALGQELWALSEVVAALSLDFHTRFRCIEGYDDRLAAWSPRLSDHPEALLHVQQAAEWVVRRIVSTVLAWGGITEKKHTWAESTRPPELAPDEASSLSTRIRDLLGPGSKMWKHETFFDTSAVTTLDLLDPLDARTFTDRTELAALRKATGAFPRELEWLIELVRDPRWLAVLRQIASETAPDSIDNDSTAALLANHLNCISLGFRQAATELGPDSRYNSGYGASPHVRDYIDEPSITLIQKDPRGLTINGSFGAVAAWYGRLSTTLVETLARFVRVRKGATSPMNTQTYGALIRGDTETDRKLVDWAVERDIRSDLTLPGSLRILLCLAAIDDRTAALDDQAARAGLRGSVLLHELWHSTIKLALRTDPIKANSQPAALRLEESMAVWLELHAARRRPGLKALVERYASAGSYPQWPYAGMQILERDFESRGLPAIKEWIRHLLDDPEAAQARFDHAMQQLTRV